MRISSINNFTYRPNFTSTTRTKYYSDSDGEFVLPTYNRELQKNVSFSTKPDVRMIVSNSTEFFRGDVPWRQLGKIFTQQFKFGKVNIYDFACSDGSEAYSIAIALIEQLGERRAQRFFPIVATDVDPEIIQMANSGVIKASDNDLCAMHRIFKNFDEKKYFDITRINAKESILRPKKILTKNVIFKQASALESLNEVEKKQNNIILARNFWKYLSASETAKTSWELANKANEKTLLMIGSYDFTSAGKYPFFLSNLGFDYHQIPDENILRIRPGYRNIITTKDMETWQKFIEANHNNYVPSYIKK